MTLTAAAPPTPRTRWQRMAQPGATLAILGAVTVALHYRDPHVEGSWGFCPSALLGIHCPGCGGLRAVHDLTNGDLLSAASSNLLFVCSIPLVVFLLGRWTLDSWRDTRRVRDRWTSAAMLNAGIVVAVVFTVARNLPGSWLAP